MAVRDVLHAWVCGEYVGRFERDFDLDKPRFVRDPNSSAELSLSMRSDRKIEAGAPQNFLDALIPERQSAKDSIRRVTHAKSTATWDLLEAIGGDLPGGVVLHPDLNGPTREEAFSRVASEALVAARIADIKEGGSGFDEDYGDAPRFSLAGAQGKFAFAQIGEQFFWSDSASPSTHIVKPESKVHAGLELIETATMRLAQLSGIAAPDTERRHFAGQSAFQVVRFDRAIDADGIPHRIHAEDFTQALNHGGDKYLVSTDEITAMLREATGDDELGYDFYRQYAFNSMIGNADAHGKNYSILFTAGGLQLAPIYDAIPIGMFADYAQNLAMPVDGMTNYLTIGPAEWIASAQESGLDVDRVLTIVAEVAAGIHEHLAETLGEIGHPRVTDAALDDIRTAADRHTGKLALPGSGAVI
ncbi:HipA domain-containing protein [Leucobacter sp. NPDC058333]|uniref:HipA domain-containing protein n=1 Tax=Leucobacter sp. NPDC058333 TaxID=3346450 RepID=UPI00364A200D